MSLESAKIDLFDASDACRPCGKVAAGQTTGLYSMHCLDCCARLVLSTHPSRDLAAAMLAAIERYPENPGRRRVLESVAQTLKKRH